MTSAVDHRTSLIDTITATFDSLPTPTLCRISPLRYLFGVPLDAMADLHRLHYGPQSKVTAITCRDMVDFGLLEILGSRIK